MAAAFGGAMSRLIGFYFASTRLAYGAVLPLSIVLAVAAEFILRAATGRATDVVQVVGVVIAYRLFLACKEIIGEYLLFEIRQQPSWAARIGYFLGGRDGAYGCQQLLDDNRNELDDVGKGLARVKLRLSNAIGWVVCFLSIPLMRMRFL